MVKKTVLQNGIRVILEQMPDSHSSTVMVWIDAGSLQETKDLNGISHFIEHMLFKGTSSRSAEKIVREIEDAGGCINAFSEKEFTCFYAKVLSEKTVVSLDILLDMVLNSVFKKEDIELERQVILEEIKMYEDTPDELVHDNLLRSFWKKHPLSLPVTGSLRSASEITRSDILEFVKNFYTPDNIIISIAGKFNEEEVLDQINKVAGHILRKAKKISIEPPVITPQYSFSKKNIEQSQVSLGLRGVSMMDNDRYASSIIDISLGGGMTSRLFQEIRERRGLVYFINTFEAMYRQSGIFGIYAAINNEYVGDVVYLILKEIERYKVHGITEEEYHRSITQLKGSLLLGLESTKFRASRNGRSELYFNKVLSIEEVCSAIDRVTFDDISRLSQYILNENYMSLSVVGPREYSSKKLSLAS